ncbi:MAG TPA: hypothetical protein VIY29_08275, partial [Ktedonobacteraceae bacterium]
SQIPAYHLVGSNIIYDTHPYPYSGKLSTDWDHAFGNISATYPVVSAESGQYDCGTDYISQLINYFDTHNIGWVGWAWVVSKGNVCHYPQLIRDYTGKPVPAMGAWEYQHLKSYLTLLAHEEIPVRK